MFYTYVLKSKSSGRLYTGYTNDLRKRFNEHNGGKSVYTAPVSNGMNFQEKVVAIVRKIPKGKVLTYKEVAKKAGRPLAFRAVGNIMGKNTDKGVPCHRVIRSDGKLGGYNGLQGQKRLLLAKEGYLR